MAKRKLKAPTSEYTSPDGDVLELRGSMTPGTRREYADTLGGSPLSQEDAWHRAVEFLFERLAVSWAVAGTIRAPTGRRCWPAGSPSSAVTTGRPARW